MSRTKITIITIAVLILVVHLVGGCKFSADRVEIEGPLAEES